MNKTILLVGGAAVLWWYFSQHQTVLAAPAQTVTGTNPPVPPTSTAPPVSAVALPGTYASLQSAMASDIQGGDPNIPASGPSPFQWTYILQNVTAPALKSTDIPLDTIFPGVDLTKSMSAATYWGGVGPWVKSQSVGAGLSGLSRGGWRV